MGDFGLFVACWGGKCFTARLGALCWGVVSFGPVMVPRLVREKSRPARLVGDKSGTKFSQQEQNAPYGAILDAQGEFCIGNAAVRLALGEFCTASGTARLVQGECCTGTGGVRGVLGDFFVPAGAAPRSCRRGGAVHVGGCGGFAALGAGWRRVAGVSDL